MKNYQYATNAEVIFVGKRFIAYSQDQINELIVVMAKKYGGHRQRFKRR
jgi:uroporphyrin-III C-methyltransferase